MPDHDPNFHSFARSADAGALRRLVARHGDAVHSAARWILVDRADGAADVAQAVFTSSPSTPTTTSTAFLLRFFRKI